MFDHFLPRYLKILSDQKILPEKHSHAGFSKPLDEEGRWCETYYNLEKLGCKRKLMFTKMKGAIKVK